MTSFDSKTALNTLCADNVRCLERLQSLVARLTDVQYVAPTVPCDSGIGAHVRHVLDHYDAVFAGLDTGVVNYDARQRDHGTQVSRTTAGERLARTIDTLLAVPDRHMPAKLQVRMDCGSPDSAALTCDSSIARELQFLVSHTVHHDALIGAAAAVMQITVDEGYGVAPSTLRFSKRAQGNG